MENKYDNLIKDFEKNVKKLIVQNKTLKAENDTLRVALDTKQKELKTAYGELMELEKQYDNLLSTNIIEGTNTVEGREKFKHFLQDMVNEIDKCIKLING